METALVLSSAKVKGSIWQSDISRISNQIYYAPAGCVWPSGS